VFLKTTDIFFSVKESWMQQGNWLLFNTKSANCQLYGDLLTKW